jgi:hypothetical protein
MTPDTPPQFDKRQGLNTGTNLIAALVFVRQQIPANFMRDQRRRPLATAIVGLAGPQATRLYGLDGIECQSG